MEYKMFFKPGALKCMIDKITRYKISIVAIQEVRWLNSGYIQSGKSIIFYSGLQTGRHEKGVGFVIDKAVMTQVKKIVPVNERICYIRIVQQKLYLIILNCYAPTENADDEEKNSFHDTLETTFDALPKNCIMLTIRDLNTQVGRE
jgi:hypothetical protein|uniref:Craniofacial development protein 2 n=1 Tax=Sipha flava TaxID=143950 RepID=A0A2S2QRZ9_9HEMI